MKLGVKRWVIALWCLGIGVLLALLAWVQFEQYLYFSDADSLARERIWIAIGAVLLAAGALTFGSFSLWKHWGTWSVVLPQEKPVVSTSAATERPAFVNPLDVPTHNGVAQSPDADFFAPPPPQIGELRSARTTLSHRKQPMRTRNRVIAISVFVLGPAAAIWWVHREPHPRDFTDSVILFASVVFLFGTALTNHFTRFFHQVTYVGTQGISVHRLKGSRARIKAPEIFRFKDASALWRTLIEKVPTGIVQFYYSWKGARGRKVYSIEGFHWVRPAGNHPHWFAKATEKVWSDNVLQSKAAEMQESGFIQFPLHGQDWVRVGWRFLEFSANGHHERCNASDIKSVELGGGEFAVTHRDATWFRRRGKYSFDLENMPNADAFLMAVDRSLGVPMQTKQD